MWPTQQQFTMHADEKCTKRYPRDILAETITGNDGYPLYRRRSTEDGNKSITLKIRNNDIEVDNRWVVPYSPLLSKTFKAHINVKYCNLRHLMKSYTYDFFLKYIFEILFSANPILLLILYIFYKTDTQIFMLATPFFR